MVLLLFGMLCKASMLLFDICCCWLQIGLRRIELGVWSVLQWLRHR